MRVVIAEDSAVLRDGMAQLLADRGHEVTATLSDGDGLERAVAETSPDLAIVDVRMLDLPPSEADHRRVLAVLRYLES
jgi:DNA-binding NarL/FixJ family response regulator